MSERIVTAKTPHVCDVCGGRIPAGTQCRRIVDDFMPMIWYHEHISCPASRLKAMEERKKQFQTAKPAFA